MARGKTTEISQWHDALLQYMIDIRRANGLSSNITRKDIVQSLIIAYASNMVSGISDPKQKSDLISLINSAQNV